MTTFGTIPHRLIPGFSISLAADPLNASYSLADAYGFSALSWDQYDAPSCGEGDAVSATSEGAVVFEGTVKSVTDAGAVGERLLYHVECVGVAESLKANATIEGVIVDRDPAQFQTYSFGWNQAPDFEIRAEVTDRIRFTWPEAEDVLVWSDDGAKLGWPDYAGNVVPPHDDYCFWEPPVCWTAAVYQIGNGASSKLITRLKFRVESDMTHDSVDAMTTPDYEHPKGEADPKYDYRHADYPNINLWTAYYEMDAPRPAFFGVYACDELAELPTSQPWLMRKDPHCVQRLETSRISTSVDLIADGLSCRFIVLYAAYIPVYKPTWAQVAYDALVDHNIRYGWQAQTRMLCEPGQYVEIYDLEICAQGYQPEPDGADDLRKVLELVYPGKVNAPPMKLPPAADGSPRSIALRVPTTVPAAVADLLSLHEDQFSWGFYEDAELWIWRPEEAPGLAIADEPGVDTTGCGVSDEGAVDLVMVAYTAPPAGAFIGAALSVPALAFLVVDKAGAYTPVTAGWTPGEGVAVAYLDAVASAQSAEAAAKMGQCVAIERRRGQASGSVNLRAIAAASTTRPGGILSGPGVPADARITAVSVSVTADTVSLSLGPSGYRGRFAPRQAGVPASATPTGAGANVTNATPQALRIAPVHS